jgi:hypothetical protein
MDTRNAFTVATARQHDLLSEAAARRIRPHTGSGTRSGLRAALDEVRSAGESYLDITPGVRRYPY